MMRGMLASLYFFDDERELCKGPIKAMFRDPFFMYYICIDYHYRSHRFTMHVHP